MKFRQVKTAQDRLQVKKQFSRKIRFAPILQMIQTVCLLYLVYLASCK